MSYIISKWVRQYHAVSWQQQIYLFHTGIQMSKVNSGVTGPITFRYFNPFQYISVVIQYANFATKITWNGNISWAIAKWMDLWSPFTGLQTLKIWWKWSSKFWDYNKPFTFDTNLVGFCPVNPQFMWLICIQQAYARTQVCLFMFTGGGTAKHCIDQYTVLFCYYLLGCNTAMPGRL